MNENLKELAYETSKQKIIQYEYRPNTFLSESLLMKEIDASRTPIREALNKLEQEGFITILPKKGVMDQSMRIRLLAGIHIWERHKESAAEHIEIIDAILQDKKETAKDALHYHLTASKTAAVQSLLKQTMPIC